MSLYDTCHSITYPKSKIIFLNFSIVGRAILIDPFLPNGRLYILNCWCKVMAQLQPNILAAFIPTAYSCFMHRVRIRGLSCPRRICFIESEGAPLHVLSTKRLQGVVKATSLLLSAKSWKWQGESREEVQALFSPHLLLSTSAVLLY